MNGVYLVTQEKKKRVKTDRKWAECTECTAQSQHRRPGRAPSAQAARLRPLLRTPRAPLPVPRACRSPARPPACSAPVRATPARPALCLTPQRPLHGPAPQHARLCPSAPVRACCLAQRPCARLMPSPAPCLCHCSPQYSLTIQIMQ